MGLTWDKEIEARDFYFGTNRATAEYVHPINNYVINSNVCFVTRADLNEILNNFAKHVYSLITEHIAVDISEEEFMKLLEG